MARLIVLYNPLDTSRRRGFDLEAGTELGAWLDANEPLGGTMTRTVWVGGAEIEPAGYVVAAHDEILAAMRPAGWEAIGYAILNALIAAAVGYVLNRLFGPGKPKAGNTPSPSQVYGIAPTRNAARLGEPIPVVYGNPIVVPDYASQPYTTFVANEQFFSAIMCIGEGFHQVTEMLLGDSSTKGLPAEVASFQVFTPDLHLSTYGTIQAATGVHENVVSSADVSDQELLAPNTTVGSAGPPSTWYWQIFGDTTTTTVPPAMPPVFDLSNPLLTEDQILAILPANPALGTVVQALVITYPPPSGPGMNYVLQQYIASAYNPNAAVPPGSFIPKPAGAAGSPKWVGPFETCKPGQHGTRIELDFVFGGGLATMDNNGNLHDANVAVRIEYRPIDDDGNYTGAAVTRDEQFTAGTNTPQRYTRGFDVPSGRYRVRAMRITDSDGKVNTSDRCNWTGLRFYLDQPPAGTAVYGAVTLVVVKLKATNGVASDAASAIRFRVWRMLAPLGVGALVPTANPADAFVDILCSRYGGNRPINDDELDLPLLAELRAKWAYHNGFNAVFDQPSTVWEALGLSVQTVVAAPLPIGSRMSIVEDAPQPVRVQLFTDVNIATGSLQVTHQWDRAGTPAGVRVEYRDPRTFSTATVFEPAGAPDYQSIDLFGCTSSEVAQQHADLTMDRRRLQRVNATFTTELEGLSCLPGQRIGIQSKTMRWGAAAWVIQVEGLALHLSGVMPWQAGEVHAVVLRDPTGKPYTVVGVTPGATDDIVVLPEPPPFEIRDRLDLSEPTHLAFGVQGEEVTDWTVQRMRPQGKQVVIEAINYAPAVWSRAAPHQRAA
jgi:hypothetical protein